MSEVPVYWSARLRLVEGERGTASGTAWDRPASGERAWGCWDFPRKGQETGYRGISLIRNTPLLGPYSRTIPRVLWWSFGGGLFLMSEVPLYGGIGSSLKVLKRGSGPSSSRDSPQ